MKIPIDVLIIGIVSLSLILAILSIYMVLKGTRDNIISRKKKYIQNKQDTWYRYFNDDVPCLRNYPNNKSEIKAIEEIFSAYVENISNPTIRKNPKFSNQYLRRYYLNLLAQEMEFKNERSLPDRKF